jgi:hypothetical protein
VFIRGWNLQGVGAWSGGLRRPAIFRRPCRDCRYPPASWRDCANCDGKHRVATGEKVKNQDLPSRVVVPSLALLLEWKRVSCDGLARGGPDDTELNLWQSRYD